MEKALRSVSHISFLFFSLFGALHIGTSMLMMQGVESNMVLLIFRSLDLPFLLAGLLYGNTRLSLHIGHIVGSTKIPLIVCSALATVLFVLALYFNFMLPDVQF